MSVKICLVGAAGKMGRAILEALLERSETSLPVSAKVDAQEGYAGFAQIGEVDPQQVDVVINFTNPQATLDSADWCLQHGKSLVTGTTGLVPEQIESLKKLASQVPILWAPNMSLGVNLIDAILPQLKPLQDFDIELMETHHRLKKDSPSGTALRWAKTLAQVFGRKIVNSRSEGVTQGRDKEEIYVQAMRGGTVPGEHTIYFFGPDEVIEITHRAASRKIFALGAIKAAKWIINQPPGFYSMKDVLGI